MTEQQIAHTDEARHLVAAGEIRPGDKALDVPIDSMTDREILTEILVHERNTRDAVNALVESIMGSPLGAMIAGGSRPASGIAAMFGGNGG